MKCVTALKRDYPDSWETFIANSAVIQVLNARDNSTAKYFSEYFGDMTYRDHGGGTINSGPANHLQTHKVPALEPFEIRQRTQSKQLILFPGGGNYWCGKTPYFAEPRFAPFYRDNPLYASRAERAKVQPVASVDEATAILKREGYSVSPAWGGASWKVKGAGQDGSLKETELLEFARTVRNAAMP